MSEIIAVTGHRPNKLGGYSRTSNPTYDHVVEETVKYLSVIPPDTTIMTGMALGFDQIVADVCILLDIPFLAVIPFAGQENKWPQDSQQEYRELIQEAERVITISEIAHGGTYMARNRYMVDSCARLLSCWNGEPQGGTWNTVKYATEKNRPIHIIDPAGWR